MEEDTSAEPKRGRGRPKGSKNKNPYVRTTDYTRGESMTGGGPREVPPTASMQQDFAHADPATMLSRQLSMISWQQQALRIKMMGGVKSDETALKDIRCGGKITYAEDTKELLDLSNALVRAIDGMKKHSDMANELAQRMTAEQLLELAIAKIEGQSLPTISYAIKRLRAKREALGPVGGLERHSIGYTEDSKATDAIASLLDEA